MNPGFEEFERRALASTMGLIVRGRIVLLIAVACFSSWVAWVDPAPWRRVVLLVLAVTLAGLDVQTRRRFMRHGYEPRSVHANLMAMLFIQAGLVFATGGVSSPLVVVMLPPAFAAGLLFGARGVRRLVAGIQVPAVIAFVALELSGALPTFIPQPFAPAGGPSTPFVLIVGLAMSIVLVGISTVGSQIRAVSQRHLERVVQAQDAALASHRQRVDELTTLSGEIAHELKNPLASVKGLSQLLARNAAEHLAAGAERDKTVERLEVLQREVARMQAILDEFLNFSRPLTPLDRGEVRLADLCGDVVTLHEAMSAERGVQIRGDVPDDLRLRGDARKIGQVVINLIQNALDVAPTGSTVEITGRTHGDGVRLRVRDHGPGLDPDVRGREFEPGVTSKATGNGLGLTIARAIAEQHGGSLELANAPEGPGCVATVTLPTDALPPAAGVEA